MCNKYILDLEKSFDINIIKFHNCTLITIDDIEVFKYNYKISLRKPISIFSESEEIDLIRDIINNKDNGLLDMSNNYNKNCIYNLAEDLLFSKDKLSIGSSRCNFTFYITFFNKNQVIKDLLSDYLKEN